MSSLDAPHSSSKEFPESGSSASISNTKANERATQFPHYLLGAATPPVTNLNTNTNTTATSDFSIANQIATDPTSFLNQSGASQRPRRKSLLTYLTKFPVLKTVPEKGKPQHMGQPEITVMDECGDAHSIPDAEVVSLSETEPDSGDMQLLDEAVMMAQRLYEEDEFMKREEIAEFLGKRGKLNILVLRKYMDHFDFTGMRLENAFRFFCSCLFLRGEAQIIDRILNEFSRRYWECNRGGVLSDQDTIYTIVYSILLLNTDLHVAQSNHKISKSEFVKNTLATIRACRYIGQGNDTIHSSVGSAQSGQSSVNSKASRSSHCEDDLVDLLKEMYTSVKHNQIPQPNDRTSGRRRSSFVGTFGGFGFQRTSSSNALRRARSRPGSRSSSPFDMNREYGRSSLQLPASSSFSRSSRSSSPVERGVNAVTLSITNEDVRYTKLGMMTRKHLYEKNNKKASNRQWKDCFVVVDKGDFRMYKADRGKLGAEFSEDWASQMGHISLRHTLSSALPPPGHSSSRPHVFALQLPNGGVYLFQASTAEKVQEWVFVCNYWAACESREPLPGGVSNLDYGWGKSGEQLTPQNKSVPLPPGYDSHVQLQDWTEPANPMVKSPLNKYQQHENLFKHVKNLEHELDLHMKLR
ncbi:SEC7-like protein, partial [Basidiobolus meristosporus CBS 931.73]